MEALHGLGEASSSQSRPDIARKIEIESVDIGPIVGLISHDAAIRYYEQALDIAREIRERTYEMRVLNSLGIACATWAQYGKAIEYYGQALDIAQKIGAQTWELNVCTNLWCTALVDPTMSQYEEEACRFLELALPRAQKQGNLNQEGTILHNLMFFWQAQAKPRLAIFYGKQAVNVFQEIRGYIRGLEKDLQQTFLQSHESTYRELAGALITEGRFPEAQQVLNLLKEEEYFNFVRRDVTEASAWQGRADLTPTEAAWDNRYREIGDRLTALGTERGALLAKISRTEDEGCNFVLMYFYAA